MLPLLLAALLEFTPQDATLAYRQAESFVGECTPRDAGTIRGRIASNFILDAASAMGADVRRDIFKVRMPNGERELINLYAEFKGTNVESRWVILLSHFDTKPGVACPGANDGASTSALLIALANALDRAGVLKGNILLVWTDGEECVHNYGETDGLWGARRAVDYVKERGYAVQAVIGVDMLGDRDLSISVPANGEEKLAKIAEHAARRAGYPDLVRRIPETVKDDFVPFLDAGYKAIGLIDFSYGPNNSWWHTPQDTMDKISEESLLKSGKVVVEMLNILL